MMCSCWSAVSQVPMLNYLCEMAANTLKYIPSADAHVHQEPHFLFLIRMKRNTHTQTVAHSQPHIDTSIFLILEFMNMKECCCAGDGFFRSSLSNNKSPTTPIMCSAPPAKQPRGPQWTQRYTHQSGILTHAW